MIQINPARHIIVCPACEGSKLQENSEGFSVLCPACFGAGEVEIPTLGKPVKLRDIDLYNIPGGLIC